MTEATPPIVQLTRWLKATPQHVFDAWTDPNQVARWLSPMEAIKQVVTEVDLRIGGSFRFGFANPDTGHVNTVAGQYLAIDPPRKLVFTWAWQPPHDDFPEELLGVESTVTIELTALDGGTQLNLTHEGLPPGPITERHTWGWNGALDRLIVHAGPGTGTIHTEGRNL